MKGGISFEAIVEAIVKFNGAKRRFQVLGEAEGILVIDDYAHHPTEIEATISAAKATGKRIIAVFQPRGIRGPFSFWMRLAAHSGKRTR